MTLEQLKRFSDALSEYYKREDMLSNAIEPLNSSYTVIEFCPDITFAIVQYIEEDLNDTSSWFSYWFYELEQGTKYEDGTITDGNGNSIKMQTIEDVYNYLMEKN